MKTQKIPFLLFIFLISLLLTSCSQVTPQVEALQAPTSTTAVLSDVDPTPSAGKGVVVGKIDMETPQDRVGLLIYLGQLIRTDKGDGGMIDTTKAPVSTLRVEDGKFQFADIEPGLYTLVIYDVGIGGKIYSDTAGNVVVVDVKSDQVLDLGNIPFTME